MPAPDQNGRWRRVLLAATLAGALSGSTRPAHGQVTDTVPRQEVIAIDGIVVTARKQEESLLEVPMSLSAVTSDVAETQGIRNVRHLIGRIPGISLSGDLLSPGRDFTSIVIRGIGANSNGADAAAPVFIDGVFQPRLGWDRDFMDIERVEILKGPQSALFGRNTEAGALNIVTRRPDEAFGGKVLMGFDEYDTFRGAISVSGRLAEGLTGILSFDGAQSGGYLENSTIGNVPPPQTNREEFRVPAGNYRRHAGRLGVNWLPSDNIQVYLTADYSRFFGLNGLPGVRDGCECYVVESEFQIDQEDRNQGLALTLDWSLDGLDITAISAYRDLSTSLPFDFDGSFDFGPNFHDLRTWQEFWSQEIRVASNSASSLQWLAGVYLFHDAVRSERRYDLQDLNNLADGQVFIDNQDINVAKNGVAAFGQLTWTFVPDWELAWGSRFSLENGDGDMLVRFTVPLLPFTDPSNDLVFDNSDVEEARWKGFSNTVSLKWSFAERSMVYATVSTGFKTGGWPLAAVFPDDFRAFDTETTTNFEVGSKGSLSEGQLQFQVAAFHTDWRDQQLSANIDVGGFPVNTILNAGGSEVDGIEASLISWPMESLRLSADVMYLSGEFTDYVDPLGVQHAGERLRFTPDFTFNSNVTWTRTLGQATDLTVSGSYRFFGDMIQGFDIPFDPMLTVPSHDVVDLSASLSRDGWSVQLYAENLANEYVITKKWFNWFFDQTPARIWNTVGPPRTVGVRLGYEF